MLSVVAVASRAPTPTSQFPWKGTLIRLETGFCVCFASSSAFWARARYGIESRPRPRQLAVRNTRFVVFIEPLRCTRTSSTLPHEPDAARQVGHDMQWLGDAAPGLSSANLAFSDGPDALGATFVPAEGSRLARCPSI